MDTSHDAFRWAGLNKSGAEVLGSLVAHSPLHISEIVALTGRSVTTVRRKLLGDDGKPGLLQLGLAEPLGDGYWCAADNPDLDRAARELGTDGDGERQRKKHIRDRRFHKLVLRQMGTGIQER